jgi:hypothetical protein
MRGWISRGLELWLAFPFSWMRNRLNGIDPQAWLADVLARIADHKIADLAALLPWNLNLEILKEPIALAEREKASLVCDDLPT